MDSFIDDEYDTHSTALVYLIENGAKTMNYTKVLLPKNEEATGPIEAAVKSELKIKIDFKLYDKNGSEIYPEDFWNLQDNDCIYVCPKREFSYCSLLSMYHKEKVLGQGGYGEVILLRHKLTSQRIASKSVDVSEFLSKANNIQKGLKEAKYLITLDHINIINLESVFLLKKNIIIFMEYIPGGELKNYLLNRKSPMSEQEALKLMKILICAIEYIHSRNVVHRDLKLENILLTDKTDPYNLKIIDFGI